MAVNSVSIATRNIQLMGAFIRFHYSERKYSDNLWNQLPNWLDIHIQLLNFTEVNYIIMATR